MTLDLSLPPGDPAGLRGFSSTLRSIGSDLATQSRALSAERARLGAAWSGVASGRASVTVLGLSTAAGEAADAMGTGADAVTRYAEVLDRAQDEVLVLRRRKADADDELAHGLAVARRTETEPLAHERASASLHAAHRLQLLALGRERARITEECERAGLVLRRALEETRGPFVRGHRESLEDYYGGIVSSLLGRLPVLSEHPDAVRALVWASMSSLPSAVRAWSAGRLLRDWRAAVTAYAGSGPAPALRPSNLPLWARSLQSRVPAVETAFRGNNWFSGATAMRGQSLTAVYGQSAHLLDYAGKVGAFRGLGLAASATATVTSTLNVVAQGNPVDAYRENGANYVADVGETLFNGSVTAMLIAPNPVTAGAVVVTGVLYAGAEIYAHREQIAALATDGARLAADVGRRGLDVAGDVLGTVDRAVDEAVDDVVGGAVDTAKKVGSALNPFD